jgi:hypothetical protein
MALTGAERQARWVRRLKERAKAGEATDVGMALDAELAEALSDLLRGYVYVFQQHVADTERRSGAWAEEDRRLLALYQEIKDRVDRIIANNGSRG